MIADAVTVKGGEKLAPEPGTSDAEQRERLTALLACAHDRQNTESISLAVVKREAVRVVLLTSGASDVRQEGDLVTRISKGAIDSTAVTSSTTKRVGGQHPLCSLSRCTSSSHSFLSHPPQLLSRADDSVASISAIDDSCRDATRGQLFVVLSCLTERLGGECDTCTFSVTALAIQSCKLVQQ